MPYNTSVSFDSVIVIESLRESDLRSGRDLFDGTIAPACHADPGLLGELYTPAYRTDFFAVLASVKKMARDFGRSPVIHLETHGNTDGIELGSGEFVNWSEIAPVLAAINQVSRMNLLVVSAMCCGWHMSSILRPTDRAPAFGIIGTDEDDISAGDLYSAMKRFYGELLSSLDLRRALDEANEHAPLADSRFWLQGAELLLCRVFAHYMSEVEGIGAQAERVSRLVADIARIRDLDVTETMQLRDELTQTINDHASWFEWYRSRFLMLDLFPENDARFPLRYDDCKTVLLDIKFEVQH